RDRQQGETHSHGREGDHAGPEPGEARRLLHEIGPDDFQQSGDDEIDPGHGRPSVQRAGPSRTLPGATGTIGARTWPRLELLSKAWTGRVKRPARRRQRLSRRWLTCTVVVARAPAPCTETAAHRPLPITSVIERNHPPDVAQSRSRSQREEPP